MTPPAPFLPPARRPRAFAPFCLSLPFLLISATGAAAQGPVIYRGATILTGAGQEIPSADLVVAGGKIVAVGKAGEAAVPEGAQVVDLAGKVVIPGLVDTHSHVGIYPRPAIEAHQDGNEMTGPAQPGIRALDAIYPGDPGILMALAGGVTTANIMPGSGNVIGGQTLYVKYRPAATVEQMMVAPGQPLGGLKMANGENPKRAYGGKNQAPGTRMKVASLQREQFLKAAAYKKKWDAFRAGQADAKEPDRDLALEPLVEVLERKRTVHFHSHRADDIMSVVRLADEFGFEVVVQHGTEAYKVAAELAKRKIGVSMTLVDSPGGKAEVLNLLEENPALLEKAGVALAINTDDFITESRFLLRTAAIAVRGGLSEAAALKALTLTPAAMMHLENRIGSIAPGKDADFVVLSGRPFSAYSQVLQTYIEGKKVYDRAEGRQANLAIGGFALPDAEARPAPAPPADRPPALAAPAGGIPAAEVPADAPRLAVRAGRLHVIGGPAIDDGVVLIEGGKITAVGKAGELAIPEGTPVLTAAVATPGLIDAFTTLGVSGWLNSPADQDQDEKSDPNQADVRTLDSFNPAEPLLRFALEHGVTVAQVTPGRVNAIAGQAGIFRTFGTTAESMKLRSPSALVFNLGEAPKSAYPNKAPSTRMGTASLIRSALAGAQPYRAKLDASKAGTGEAPDPDLKKSALALALSGEIPSIFAAHRADDLSTALRLSTEFGLKSQLALATEAYRIPEVVTAAKLPILAHPPMQRVGSPETYNTTLTLPGTLDRAGLPLAIGTGFEDYVPKSRVLLYEASIAAANGLPHDRALRSITLGPAEILGLSDRFGSLTPGKSADLVLYDGDPFEYTTHVLTVLVDGRVAFDLSRDGTDPSRFGPAAGGGGEFDCCMGWHLD
jgi:imidazolonepropionase-like amidohydrolase